MLDRNKVNNFFNDIVEVYIVGEDDIYSDINCALRAKSEKLRGLCKTTGRILVKKEATVDFADIIQVVLLNILETMIFAKKNKNMSEEEFHRLFLYYGTEIEDEDRIKSSMLYNLILQKCKQYQYRVSKVEEKRAFKNINGLDINIRNFSDYEATNNKGQESTIEEIIDVQSFDNNCLYLQEEAPLELQKWIESKYVILTENQREYLINPNKFETSSRTKYQRRIEEKLRKKALEEFGTSSSKIIKLLIERDTIENILDAEDIQEAIVHSLEYISELKGYYDIEQVYRTDINKAYHNSDYVCSNKSLIILCKLLHNRLDKLKEALNGYDVDSKKEEVIKNNTKFVMKNIPNIDLTESEEFPKFIKGKSQLSYVKFQKLHKDVFEKGLKIDIKFYNYLYFCKWLKESTIDSNKRYFFFYDKGMIYLLPESLSFVNNQSNVTYDKAMNKYKARVRVGGKTYDSGLVDDRKKAEEDLIRIKSQVLRDVLLPKNKNLITEEAYNFLVDFKFELK